MWMACVIKLLFRVGSRDTMWSLHISGRQMAILAVVCGGNAWIIGRSEGIIRMAICTFAGCLLTACVMDLSEHMVYRYVWVAAGISAVILCVMGNRAAGLFGYVVFVLIQQTVFARMYGRADCHAFCVCAAVLMAFGGSFSDYVTHMMLSFTILTIVQLGRKNVLPSGRLKIPVPMLPYITAGFWLWLDFGMQK